MGYNTEATEWPSCVGFPDENKAVIDSLFKLLDDPSKGVGDQLADNTFTSDAVMVASAGRIEGTEAIRKCRDEAWKIVTARRHYIERVYVHDVGALDLQLVGKVVMTLSNGKDVGSEFTARMILQQQQEGQVKIKLYTVIADTAPIRQAMQEAAAAK